MSNSNLTLYIDVFFCVVLLPVMTMLLPIESWVANHLTFVLFLVVWLYAVYFINRRLTVPILLIKKNYLLATVIFVLTVIITYFISKYHMGFDRELFVRRTQHRLGAYGLSYKIRLHEQGVWFLYIVVTTFSAAVSLLTELYKQMMEKQELAQEKDKAELALYKAQINPHFLFNTLNTLYGLIITKSDKAENAFMQFTGMMRYLYTNGTADFISVEEEAEYIRQYIELQKNRINEHTTLHFEVNDNCPEARIAPMLLITFVENAFKYGVSSHIDSRIDIRLDVDPECICLNVSNTVIPENRHKKGDGIGIRNCRKRLELLYPGKYTLDVNDEGDFFTVRLTIGDIG